MPPKPRGKDKVPRKKGSGRRPGSKNKAHPPEACPPEECQHLFCWTEQFLKEGKKVVGGYEYLQCVKCPARHAATHYLKVVLDEDDTLIEWTRHPIEGVQHNTKFASKDESDSDDDSDDDSEGGDDSGDGKDLSAKTKENSLPAQKKIKLPVSSDISRDDELLRLLSFNMF